MAGRQAGLRGRLPVKPVGERFAIRWAHEYLRAPLPTPTYPVDVTGGLTSFGVLANDKLGDCAEAALLHLDMLTALGAGQPVPSFTDAEASTEYLDYEGPAGDVGVVLADFLLWLYNKHRILAFAPIDYTSKASVDGFLQAGHGAYVGVSLTDDAETLFGAGQEWTVANGEAPDPNLGHCVVKAAADGKGTDVYVTWGQLQPATESWSAVCVDEAWLVITTYEALAAFDPALLDDIAALGGTGGQTAPVPAPAPAPAPTVPGTPPIPPPNVDPFQPSAHQDWLADAQRWYDEAMSWVEAHT